MCRCDLEIRTPLGMSVVTRVGRISSISARFDVRETPLRNANVTPTPGICLEAAGASAGLAHQQTSVIAGREPRTGPFRRKHDFPCELGYNENFLPEVEGEVGRDISYLAGDYGTWNLPMRRISLTARDSSDLALSLKSPIGAPTLRMSSSSDEGTSFSDLMGTPKR
jgi:hypothetical protein